MDEEYTFELSDDDEALLGQAIINKAIQEKLAKQLAQKVAMQMNRDLTASTQSHVGDATAYKTVKTKTVSGYYNGGSVGTTNVRVFEDDWRWEHDKSQDEQDLLEEEREKRSDNILNIIYPELSDILEIQKKAVVKSAADYVEAQIRNVEAKLEGKYGQRIRDLESKLELLLAMQNDNFGKF